MQIIIKIIIIIIIFIMFSYILSLGETEVMSHDTGIGGIVDITTDTRATEY